jgi:hypothetical protein
MDSKKYFDSYITDGGVKNFGKILIDLSEKNYEVSFDETISSLLGFIGVPDDDFGHPYVVTGVAKKDEECRVVFQWVDSPSIGKSETRYSYLVVDEENISMIQSWIYERCLEKEKEIKRKEESVMGETVKSLTYDNEEGYQVFKIHLMSGKIIEVIGSDMVSNLIKNDGGKVPVIHSSGHLLM